MNLRVQKCMWIHYYVEPCLSTWLKTLGSESTVKEMVNLEQVFKEGMSSLFLHQINCLHFVGSKFLGIKMRYRWI